jgi:hypothetical protein
MMHPARMRRDFAMRRYVPPALPALGNRLGHFAVPVNQEFRVSWQV